MTRLYLKRAYMYVCTNLWRQIHKYVHVFGKPQSRNRAQYRGREKKRFSKSKIVQSIPSWVRFPLHATQPPISLSFVRTLSWASRSSSSHPRMAAEYNMIHHVWMHVCMYACMHAFSARQTLLFSLWLWYSSHIHIHTQTGTHKRRHTHTQMHVWTQTGVFFLFLFLSVFPPLPFTSQKHMRTWSTYSTRIKVF